MPSIDLKTLTIRKAREHLIRGDFSAVDLATAYVKEIETKNPELNAYLEVFDDIAKQAERADKVIAEKKDKSPALAGIPLALKDNILVRGRTVSCASKILESYTASYDAFVTKRLREASAVILGRTNMDEFAMGSSTEYSAFGPAKNPHDTARAPGGSSGGAASAVAGNMALGAFGSDTGGSIRQPASFCGLAGMLPTYGTVSRSGLVAMASSFDQIGPLAKTSEDARILLEAVAGHDLMDATSYPEAFRAWRKAAVPEKLKVGVPRHLFQGKEGVDADVTDSFERALELLRRDGHEVFDVSLPNAEYALPAYYIIMPAEASTNLARFDGVRYGLYRKGEGLYGDYAKTRRDGFGKEVRRRILLGTHVLSSGYYDAYYNKAMAVRALIREDFVRVFKDVHVLALPSCPTPAFKLGDRLDDPVSMYLSDIFTVSANNAGVPALSVPVSSVKRGGSALPVGFQLIGAHFADELVLHAGDLLEKLSRS